MFTGDPGTNLANYTMEARLALVRATEHAEGTGARALAPEHVALGLVDPGVSAAAYLPRGDARSGVLDGLAAFASHREVGGESLIGIPLPLDAKTKIVLNLAHKKAGEKRRAKVTSSDGLCLAGSGQPASYEGSVGYEAARWAGDCPTARR